MSALLRRLAARDGQYPLPIFVFLTGLLVWVTVAAISDGTAQAAGAWLRGAMPAGLLVLHLVAHWYSPRLATNERLWICYTLAQAALGAALTLLTANLSVWVALFAWLIGETAGLVARPWLASVSLAVYGAVAATVLFAVADVPIALSWLGASLPTTLFVCVVVVLYKRQVEASERAQRLVAELETANRQIAAYAGRVAELTLANERQRMARELHDTLAQGMAGLVLQLEAAQAHLEAQRTERGRAIVAQALQRARTTLRDARNAIDDLRARDGQSSLSGRLESLCAHWRGEAELACQLTVDAGIWDTALPEETAEQLERIVLEALTNVRRHARATEVHVTVTATAGSLRLCVIDDGAGFRPDAVPAVGHYGLAGIVERAALLGGVAHISSAPGTGTTVDVRLPLPAGPATWPEGTPAARERSRT